MKLIKWTLKALGALLTFVLLSLVATYLTLDLGRLEPSLERLLSNKTGAEADLTGLSWSALNALHVQQLKLTWPLTPDEEEAWARYRAAKRAQREGTQGEGSDEGSDEGSKERAEPAEQLERPLPALAVCATSVSLSAALWPLLSGEALDVHLDGRLLSCLDSPDEPLEGASRRLQLALRASHEAHILGEVPNSGLEMKVSFNLSELPSSELAPLMKRLPLPIKGSLQLNGELTLPLNKRGSLKPRQGDGLITLEGSALSNEKGLVGAFEVPKLRLGELYAKLRLTQGTLYFDEVRSRSPDLTSEVTGSVGVRSSLDRLALKTHLSIDISDEFVKATPEIKTIAMLQRKFFKPKGGGYHVGVLLQGSPKRLNSSPREFSPYSKSGRAQQREQRASSRPQKRASASKPPVNKRGVNATATSRPRPKRTSVSKPQRKRANARPQRRAYTKGKRQGVGLKARPPATEALGPLAGGAEEEAEVELEDSEGEAELEEDEAEGGGEGDSASGEAGAIVSAGAEADEVE